MKASLVGLSCVVCVTVIALAACVRGDEHDAGVSSDIAAPRNVASAERATGRVDRGSEWSVPVAGEARSSQPGDDASRSVAWVK